jgi:photosystem II stability/assembly factor-like uncharacterized protein
MIALLGLVGESIPLPGARAQGWSSNGPDIGWVTVLARPLGPRGPIFAGTYGGGVFRSDDGGQTWLDLSNNVPDAVVWDIEVGLDPVGSLYLATEDRGVLRSGLLGGFWSAANTGLNDPFLPAVWALAVQPDDPLTITAATSSGMATSHTRGSSWPDSLKWTDAADFADCEISPLRPRTFYALQHAALYVSTTRELPPTRISAGLPDAAYFMDLELWPGSVDSMLAVDFEGGLYQLRDQDHFVEIGPGDALGEPLRLYTATVDPDDPDRIWVGADRGLYVSEDRGQSWERREDGGSAHPEIWAALVDDAARRRLLLGSFSRGVLATSSDGADWSVRNRGLRAGWVLGLHAWGGNVLAGTAHGRIFLSRDVGGSWIDVTGDLDQLRVQDVLSLRGSGRWLAATVDGIFYSEDEGQQWVRATIVSGRNRMHQLLQPEWMGEGEVLCASEAGILVSVDGGTSWSLLGGLADSNSRYFAIAAAEDSTMAFAAFSRGIYFGRYGGRYELLNAPPELSRLLRALVFISKDGSTLLAGGDSESFLGGGALYRVDLDPVTAEQSFTDLTANVPVEIVSVEDLAHDPGAEEAYLGLFGEGVFRSRDGGARWTAWNEGIEARRVERLALRPGVPTRVYVATLAKGVWARNADDSVPTLIRSLRASSRDGVVLLRFEVERPLRARLERIRNSDPVRIVFDRVVEGTVEFRDTGHRWAKPEADTRGAWRYRLRVADPGSEIWLAQAETVIELAAPALSTSRLLPNLPNPFNPRTLLRWEVARPGRLRISIHDSRGRMVRLVVDEDVAAGSYSWAWDGDDDGGHPAASGIYHVRMEHGGRWSARAITLVR